MGPSAALQGIQWCRGALAGARRCATFAVLLARCKLVLPCKSCSASSQQPLLELQSITALRKEAAAGITMDVCIADAASECEGRPAA
jgi:hypothetical protein